MSLLTRHNMHSLYLPTSSGDSVIVKEQVVDTLGKSTPKLTIFDNPNHDFYITKPRYRTYNFKTESERIDRLDRYTVPNHLMKRKIADLMGIRGRYLSPRALYRSPYIFGADISIEAIIKMRYIDAAKGATIKPTYGFIDIETRIESGEIIMVSFLAGGDIYTAVRRAWLFKEENKRRIEVTHQELEQFVHEKLSKHTDMSKYKIHLSLHDTEIDMLISIFKAIHTHKVDFIGAWNMDFDVSKIIDAIQMRSKYKCADLFCDPKLKAPYRVFEYKRDTGKTAHFTLKWHWVKCSSHSQWIDLMGLYSQCRRTKKFLGRYTLDAILSKHCGTHKMELITPSDTGGLDTHTYMQDKHIREYVAYNIFDVIGLDILESINNDILTMHMACKTTTIKDYAKATVMNTNNLYYDIKQRGLILSSKSTEDRFLQMEKLFGKNNGGTVLNPTYARDVGLMLH